MDIQPKTKRFNENILSKYQIYNSIFITLPFDNISNTGVLMPLLKSECEKGFAKGLTPIEIIDRFFLKYQDNIDQKEQINLLFKFIQYIERQVVLFDAIEDAAFPITHNMDGKGTLRNAKEEAFSQNKKEALQQYLEDFKVRIVLTAHPTQFYPGSVLGIITDLTTAIENNDLVNIKKLLAQLGVTPFLKAEKPTPLDEAINLIWYLENIFYHSAASIFNYIESNIYEGKEVNNEFVSLGFWPGGDRDGNPFVTTEITEQVALKLRQTVIRSYYRDIRKLRRKLTFRKVSDIVLEIENKLYRSFINPTEIIITHDEFSSKLLEIKELLVNDYQSLYLTELKDLIHKSKIFGFYFATLDIRQDSRIHHQVFTKIADYLMKGKNQILPKNYHELDELSQMNLLSNLEADISSNDFKDELVVKTLGSIEAIKKIQHTNGEKGANRYIISNNQSSLNVMQVFSMLKMTAFKNDLTVDVVPLFETVDDLINSSRIMEELYTNKAYRAHVKNRGNKQTIMLGFSDGTKDGGYLMANWSIFKAKEELTRISRKYNIKAIFFDGRGGPPARGGGKTHQFYASLGPTIENEEVQLTIQGQTISSNFGTSESAQYNLEQLISSGVSNEFFDSGKNSLSPENREIMNELANISYKAYSDFKNHDKFLPYLEKISTLKYYAKTNIGSRPSKRKTSDQLNFSDLRAIPFVGSWSQLKQNVPGFFGVGTALLKFEEEGNFDKVVSFYNNSKFFKSLIDNSMMAMKKSFFELTRYMEKDPEFGEFWTLIYEEFLRSKRLVLKLANQSELMQNYPISKSSIEVRESIVLPLLTIQQYALKKVQDLNSIDNPDKELLNVYEKIITRSLFGNINASRNSA
ncbi:phosphoenolpyruvate carboxylase [Lutimonas zeaxanthinifaciens]|uniref:phosphoenolpyruvate carboxylase n=1 Tax=Lutimonas zeaxanthinifaciens TaxID=3060215 RepID=UPI00265D5CFD|nr:phosphoenolpyruvate carboxylase [Lutimonas sp. YSD2104]WKK64681.1 phosphoenolpyruvate carboxylase [Lutimonas sp. YSD2104]